MLWNKYLRSTEFPGFHLYLDLLSHTLSAVPRGKFPFDVVYDPFVVDMNQEKL